MTVAVPPALRVASWIWSRFSTSYVLPKILKFGRSQAGLSAASGSTVARRFDMRHGRSKVSASRAAAGGFSRVAARVEGGLRMLPRGEPSLKRAALSFLPWLQLRYLGQQPPVLGGLLLALIGQILNPYNLLWAALGELRNRRGKGPADMAPARTIWRVYLPGCGVMRR